MILNWIKFLNFRNHSNSVLEFTKKINLILGPNAAGKTSVVDGLTYLLLGRNSRTEKSGCGANELITFGEKQATITSDITETGVIKRLIPNDLEIAGFESNKITEKQEKIFTSLNTNEDSLDCVLNSSAFIDMDSNKQREFLFRLMGISFNRSELKKKFISWAKQNDIENAEVIFDSITFPESEDPITDIYNEYFNKRKIVNKDLKIAKGRYKEILAKIEADKVIERTEAEILEVNTRLNDLKKSKDDLLLRLGEVKKLDKFKHEKKKELEEANEQLSKINDIPYTIPQIEEKLNTLEIEEKKLISSKASSQAKREMAQRILSVLPTLGGKCALVNIVKCPIKDEEKDKIAMEMKMQIETEDALYHTVAEQYEIVVQRIQKGKQMMKELDIRTRLLDKIGPLQGIINEKEVVDAKTLEVELVSLNERISKGESILKRINDNKVIIVEKDTIANKITEMEKDIAMYEIIVDAFGAKGIKTNILKSVIDTFSDSVNERLSMLTDSKYKIEFIVKEDEFDIDVLSKVNSDKYNIFRKLRHLSTSERLRIGIVIQDTIARLSGLKLLVIDNVEILDINNRKLFFGMLNQIKNDYDRIIVLATHTGVPVEPTVDMNVFNLDPSEKKENLF